MTSKDKNREDGASLKKVFKPELTTLEACHRLAPSEGQKENREE